MFVSSYSTYISNNTNTDRSIKDKLDLQKEAYKPFGSSLSKAVSQNIDITKNLPIDYVSNNRTYSNKQKILEDSKSKETEKYKKISDMKSAKTAYLDNSIMFSLLKKPSLSLRPAEAINKTLPQNIQKIVEDNLKQTMANTYIENDMYYKITA